MTTLREASQQALDALETLSDCYDGDDDYDGECASCHTRSYLPHDADCKRNNAITTLRAALAQQSEPVQEPVAWRYKPMIGSLWSLSDDGYYISCKRDKRYIIEPLYTAPPQRQPLTEEKIDALWRAPMSADWEHREFARAIEQAHGIIESEIKEDKA